MVTKTLHQTGPAARDVLWQEGRFRLISDRGVNNAEMYGGDLDKGEATEEWDDAAWRDVPLTEVGHLIHTFATYFAAHPHHPASARGRTGDWDYGSHVVWASGPFREVADGEIEWFEKYQKDADEARATGEWDEFEWASVRVEEVGDLIGAIIDSLRATTHTQQRT